MKKYKPEYYMVYQSKKDKEPCLYPLSQPYDSKKIKSNEQAIMEANNILATLNKWSKYGYEMLDVLKYQMFCYEYKSEYRSFELKRSLLTGKEKIFTYRSIINEIKNK